MIRALKFALSVAALSVFTVCAGCNVLAPRPDTSRFYVLTPALDPANGVAASAAPASPSGLNLGLGPIAFPEYLDHAQMVKRVSENRVELSSQNRWAEPLAQSFTQTLSNNLSQSLGARSVIAYPWYRSAAPDYQIRIQVVRFETDWTNSARLVASWTIVDPASGRQLSAGTSNLTEPEKGPDAEASAAALSRVLGAFSNELAAAVRQAENDRKPGKPNRSTPG